MAQNEGDQGIRQPVVGGSHFVPGGGAATGKVDSVCVTTM